MSEPLLSTFIIVAAAGLFILLERRFPYDARQRLLRSGFWTDLFWYTLIQNWALAKVIAVIIRGLDIFASGRLHLVGSWPLPMQCIFFLLLHDFYIYWFHRWQHRWPLLWRIHEVHHSTTDVDFLSGTRSHFLEILINQTIEFAPIVLLGAPPEVAFFKVTIDAVWGMYIHSNIDARTGWVQYILNGPEMHRWHHAVEIINVNFATKFAFWDWMFGTAHLPKHKPGQYGLVGTGFPSGFFAQTFHAFRSSRSRARSEPLESDELPATA